MIPNNMSQYAEPASRADELREGLGDIRLCNRTLDALQDLVGAAPRDRLEAQDTLRPTSANAYIINSEDLTSSGRSEQYQNSADVPNDEATNLHMFHAEMSISRLCSASPVKYEAGGPMSSLSFCSAMYLYAEKAPSCVPA